MQYFNLFDTLIINSYKSKEQMEERKKLMPRAKHRYWDQSIEPEEWGETPIQVSNRSDIYNRIATDRSAINEVCILPKTKGWIHWDGSIQMCCNDWTDTNVFGNIKTDNFFDVWKHNPELQKLKQELWEGNRAANPICATCNRLPTNRDRNKIKWLKKLEMI
jgi:radical SAM protein with 4Fe4S-binding SPASM domain